MELKKNQCEPIEEYFSREIDPILKAVANEKNITLMSVGTGRVEEVTYKPHNCRRWITFNKTNLISFTFINPSLKYKKRVGSIISCRKINYGKETFFEFENYNITIKKNTAMVQLKLFSKKSYDIPLSQDGVIKIKSIVKKIDEKSIEYLKRFIEHFGGQSDFQIIKRHSEDKCMNDKVFDYIDKSSKWDNVIAKKVYSESLIELKNPVFFQNYVINRGIEDISPEIYNSLNDLKKAILLINPVRFIKSVVKSIPELLEFSDFIKTLSRHERSEINNWSFRELGVS